MTALVAPPPGDAARMGTGDLARGHVDVTSRHAPEDPVHAPVEDQAEQQG